MSQLASSLRARCTVEQDDLAIELRRRLGLLTAEEVASIANVDERTLANWRSQRSGPAYCKAGKTVLYREASLMAWLASTEEATQP